MTGLEIILLLLGAVVFIASFIVPESKSELDAVDKQFTQEQLQEMLKNEMKNIHAQVSDIVEETVSYSMEKTERALERLTNEKITAVSEYTETVLSDIHKSHEEVMFLYDMLNDKHENLKETVSEVTQTVKQVNTVVEEAAQTQKEVTQAAQALDEVLQSVQEEQAEAADDDFQPIDLSGIEKLRKQQPINVIEQVKPAAKSVKKAKTGSRETAAGKEPKEQPPKKAVSKAGGAISIQFDPSQNEEAMGSSANNNERILQLHQDGKSNVAIAKELGLGVGEVKLVIDLFKGL